MNNSYAKRTVLGALIITMSLIIIGISGSYAYFTSSVEKVPGSDGGVSFTSGDLTMDFVATDYINAEDVNLIDGSKYTTLGKKSAFSISLPSTTTVVSEATYDIFLTDVKLTANLKSQYLKWALHDSTKMVNSGTFATAELSSSQNADGTYDVTSFNILSGQSITKGETDSYTLYLWLENDPDVNQADKSGAPGAVNLLGGKLYFKIGFKATT